ncbi:MAG: hypothetical protein ABIP94_23970, partial [Planctomycetota bacterium]
MPPRSCQHWLPLILVALTVGCSAGSGTGSSSSSGGTTPPTSEPIPEPCSDRIGGVANPFAIVLEFGVENTAATERTETIRASVPFPEGGYASLANVSVAGQTTAWLPLQRWADGSIKIAQAQFTDTLAAGESKSYTVVRDEPSQAGAFTRNAWVEQMAPDLVIAAEVRDTFSVAYRAAVAGEGAVVQETPAVQTKRWRTYHEAVVPGTGIGRDYLTSTFYVTEYRDMPFLMVDWMLGNDYLGADSVPAGSVDKNLRALGTVDVRSAQFLCRGASAVLPYRPMTESIGAGEPIADGFTSFQVMHDTYLADAQTRRYRFLLSFVPVGASGVELAQWRATANAMLEHPCFGLASQRTWEETTAAGLLGGPIPGPADSHARAETDYQAWLATDHFGTWGTHGDVQASGQTGTPRNGPLSGELAHAIQGQHAGQLAKLEQMAWAQAMRPYHLWNLHVGAEQMILLWDGTPVLALQGESLGRRLLANQDSYPQYRTLSAGQPRAHGWQHFDVEHWTCDLLFDYYTISGDAWAKEELRQLGESLKGTIRLKFYYTSNLLAARAEGWCMQGFAQVYQATRDEAIRAYAMRRVDEIIDVRRQKAHPSRALVFQANYPVTQYPLNHEYYMPWQHGAVMYGFLGAYRCFGCAKLLAIAEDAVHAVDYGWVTNVNSAQFGFVPNGLRYYVPVTYNGVPVPADYWDGLPMGIRFGDSP